MLLINTFDIIGHIFIFTSRLLVFIHNNYSK